MQIKRNATRGQRAPDLASELQELRRACLGCEGCTGPCLALIEAVTVPDIVLRRS